MENRVVIVTGASPGIGFATAKKFLQKGNRVVILSTNEAKGKRAQAALAEFGEVVWKQCDVSSYSDCIRAADETAAQFGRIDVLVNCAGVVSTRNSFLQVDMENVRRTLDINVM